MLGNMPGKCLFDGRGRNAHVEIRSVCNCFREGRASPVTLSHSVCAGQARMSGGDRKRGITNRDY